MERLSVISVFVVSAFLLNVVQYGSSERFNIIPSLDSPCPRELSGEPCITLRQYAANPSLSSNVTLELHSGNHRLDSTISATNINSFIMTSRANATVTVNCSQLQSGYYYWFRFDRVQQLHVSGITFVGCTMNLNHVTNITFVKTSLTFVNSTNSVCCSQALYIQYSTSVLIKECTISNHTGYYQVVYGSSINSFTVDKSKIVNNINYFDDYPYYGSGGAVIYLSLNRYYNGSYHYYGHINIINSNFSGNRAGRWSSGSAVYVANAQGVSIHNTRFYNNMVAYGSGSAAVYVANAQGVIIYNARFYNNMAEYGSGSAVNVDNVQSVIILNSYFYNNTVKYGSGGAVDISYSVQTVTIHNTLFRSNRAGYQGGAVRVQGWQNNIRIMITNCNFSNNTLTRTAADYYYYGGVAGGALHISSQQDNNFIINIENVYFYNNRAGNMSSDGGAIYFDGGNITVTNSTFINNTALSGGGGAIYSNRRNTTISLTDNTFSYNTAAYCGVIDIDEFFHNYVNFTGNTFTYNRAVGLVEGNNGGGVICIRNASISLIDNDFSHNAATGNAGVIRVDESDVIVQGSIFSNNTAGGDGGVFHTYFYPTTYSISHSSFTDNRAGGDGGVMYVGRAGSHVDISQSTFTFNSATNRGGVLAVIGSAVHINGANISDNTAQLGEVVSACNSNVTIFDPQISPTQDPIYSFCSLYDSSNRTVSRTTPQDSTSTTPDEATTTRPTTTQEGIPQTANETVDTADTTETVDTTSQIMTTVTVDDHTTSTPLPLTDVNSKTNTETASDGTGPITTPTDEDKDSAQYNIHSIIPGYIAIGVSILLVVMLMIVIVFGAIIVNRLFQTRSTNSQKLQRRDLNAYPTLKNEYTLPDVHILST